MAKVGKRDSISLFEHKHVEVTLDERQIHQLNMLNARYKKKKILSYEPQSSSIHAHNHVGVIQLGSTRIQILPKIYYQDVDVEKDRSLARKQAIGNLLYMLRVAEFEEEIHFADVTNYAAIGDFFEILVKIFLDHFRRILKRGMYFQYVDYEDDLRFLRGKLVVSEQIKRIACASPRAALFPCRYDEFTTNNPINRTLYQTLHLLLARCTNSLNRQTLYGLLDFFSDMELPPITLDEVHQIHFTRLNAHLKSLVRMCALFLAHLAPTGDDKHGKWDFFAFTFDMEKLFEKYVSGLLLKYGHYTDIKQSKNLALVGNDHAFLLIPDIVIGTYPRVRIIIDTKYKELKSRARDAAQDADIERRHGVASGDFYQMLAYSVGFACAKIVLLYPASMQFPQYNHGAEFTVAMSPTPLTVIVRTLNLNQDLKREEQVGEHLLTLIELENNEKSNTHLNLTNKK